MTGVFKKVLLGSALAATAIVTTATPADAQYRRYRHHGDDAAIAIGAGILGLGVGAAIASGSRGYYDPYYGNGYSSYGYSGYSDPYYGGYYSGGYGNYGGYGSYDGYYTGGYDGYYAPSYRCVTRRVWDGYARRYVRVRSC